MGQGGIWGAGINSLLGAGIQATNKVLQRIKTQTSKTLKKFAGSTGEEGLSITTTPKQLERSEVPGVTKKGQKATVAEYDEVSGKFMYGDKGRQGYQGHYKPRRGKNNPFHGSDIK